jgi:hypothetical protein
MNKIKNDLTLSIKKYLEEYPQRKLDIDLKSETFWELWNEFNYKGFLHQVEAGPLNDLRSDIIDSNNKVFKLKLLMNQTELTKINFHFGDDKDDTVIINEKILLQVIKSILLEWLPEKNKLRKTNSDSLAAFINKTYLTIQGLKQHGMNNDFIAFFLGTDVDTVKKTIRDIKKRRGQTGIN